ncbi:MAG: 1-deoxy-D-xylulose-5-phosphate reductoisomerase, partial [Pseudomonadota bacterium]|nr:1-deoxy-D-xylulose-5-phosphate reductoisomerase [Pseudomonadota bacterium]
NAANEVAVDAFLARRIRFDQIHRVNVQTLSDCRIERLDTDTVEGLLDLDAQARRVASSVVSGLTF